jgi:hypothetical protein
VALDLKIVIFRTDSQLMFENITARHTIILAKIPRD